MVSAHLVHFELYQYTRSSEGKKYVVCFYFNHCVVVGSDHDIGLNLSGVLSVYVYGQNKWYSQRLGLDGMMLDMKNNLLEHMNQKQWNECKQLTFRPGWTTSREKT